MASEQLKAAYEAAVEKLSLKDQDMLAKDILARIEEMEWEEKWEEAFAQPVEEGSSMWEIEEEAKANINAGNVIAYVPGEELVRTFWYRSIGDYSKLKSNFEPKFRDFYRQLPSHVQRQANKSFELFASDHRHPSLQFKCVDKSQSKYSIRINNSYRVLGYICEDCVSWYWIGPHDEYMRRIRK